MGRVEAQEARHAVFLACATSRDGWAGAHPGSRARRSGGDTSSTLGTTGKATTASHGRRTSVPVSGYGIRRCEPPARWSPSSSERRPAGVDGGNIRTGGAYVPPATGAPA
jgi:hypothetical protein